MRVAIKHIVGLHSPTVQSRQKTATCSCASWLSDDDMADAPGIDPSGGSQGIVRILIVQYMS